MLDAGASATLSVATRAGIVMGTVAYMSPEQASGAPVDKRTDIWAFGVVLFEMLAGRRLFEGETTSHTMADVLRADIDWTKLPASTPAPIRTLLERCLERDRKRRLQAIGEARIQIEDYLAQASPSGSRTVAVPAPAAAPRASSAAGRLPWAIAAVAVAAVLGAVGWMLHLRRAEVRPLALRADVRITDTPSRPISAPASSSRPTPRGSCTWRGRPRCSSSTSASSISSTAPGSWMRRRARPRRTIRSSRPTASGSAT